MPHGFYYTIFAIILIVGFLLTFRVMKGQQSKERDTSISATTAKNKVFGNVGMLFYAGAFVVLLIVLLIGVLIYK